MEKVDGGPALSVELRAQVRQFEKALHKSANEAESKLRQIEKRFETTNRKLDKDALKTRASFAAASGGLDQLSGSVRRWAGVVAGAFSVREVTRMADAFTALQNKLRVAGLSGQELEAVQGRLFASASRNGVEVSALGDLYGRLALSTGELGISQGELLRFTDGVTAALRVQGTSTQAASGALLQLSQALSAGTVRAEEMNSIMEATPIIAQAAARGLGVSVGQLRQQVVAGTVSSQAFFAALMRGFPEIEKQAEKATLTIGQSLTGLRNELLRYVGQQNEALGASERMAKAIEALAKNVDHIVPVIGGLTAAWGVGYVASAVAAGAATKNLDKALMLIRAHPVVAALTVLTAGLTAVALEARNVDRAMGDLRGSIDQADAVIQAATGASTASASAVAALGGEAVTAEGRMTRFAGAVGAAAANLYELARAKRAAALSDLATQREEVSRNVATLQLGTRGNRRQNFWDELNFSGRNAVTMGESWQRGMRFFAGEWNALVSGGASDAKLEESIRDGMASLRRLDGEARRVAAIPDEVWAEQARQLRAGSASATGAGVSGGRSARAASGDAQRFSQLRGEIDRLTYDLLSDTERAAVDLVRIRDMLNEAVAAGYLTRDRATEMEAAFAGQGLMMPPAARVQPLEGYGREVFDGLRQAVLDRQAEFDELGRGMARSFTDLLRADDLGEEIGNRFRAAAFNRLEEALSGLFSGLAQNGPGWVGAITRALLPGYASGGVVRGPGTGTSDSVPAMLSKGEYVVRAAVAQRFGPLLDALNRGHGEKLAAGGLVGTTEAGAEPLFLPR